MSEREAGALGAHRPFCRGLMVGIFRDFSLSTPPAFKSRLLDSPCNFLGKIFSQGLPGLPLPKAEREEGAQVPQLAWGLCP